MQVLHLVLVIHFTTALAHTVNFVSKDLKREREREPKQIMIKQQSDDKVSNYTFLGGQIGVHRFVRKLEFWRITGLDLRSLKRDYVKVFWRDCVPSGS